MLLKQNISAPLKLMLSALLLLGCNPEQGIQSHKVGYLTADLKGGEVKVSQFVGTLVKESRPAGLGVVNLEVKVESNSGETIEFMILDYQENKIYTLEEVTYKESSGSLRYCVAGRFFFDLVDLEPVLSSGKNGRYLF